MAKSIFLRDVNIKEKYKLTGEQRISLYEDLKYILEENKNQLDEDNKLMLMSEGERSGIRFGQDQLTNKTLQELGKALGVKEVSNNGK